MRRLQRLPMPRRPRYKGGGMLSFDELSTLARAAGVDDLGVTPIAGEWLDEENARFQDWLHRGLAGPLQWLCDGAEARAKPWTLLRAQREITDEERERFQTEGSALVLWITARPGIPTKPDGLYGEIAYTGQGRDYHNVARRILKKLQRALLESDPDLAMFSSCDAGPVLERAFARRAGLGFIGKNHLLIHPRFGSYGHIAVLLLSKSIEGAPERPILPTACGDCDLCLRHCKTGAIGPHGVNVRRCLSFWTIEHRGELPPEIEQKLGLHIFGCEDCQKCCPYNRERLQPQCPQNPDPEVWRPDPARIWPHLPTWLRSIPDLTGSALNRPGIEALTRTLLCALTNAALQNPRFIPDATEALTRALNDDRPLIAQTARRQLARIHNKF